MLSSERRSFFRFFSIYLGSTFILFLLATFIFYDYQRYQIIEIQNTELNIEAERITQKLRQLNQTFTKKLIYPHKAPFDSAIYDIDKQYIFGSFSPEQISWNKEYYHDKERLYHLHPLYPYYLGASYLLISKNINQEPIDNLRKMSILFLLIAGIFFTLLGLFLGRLFIAPMKESIEKMNKFIEDTTHEFNTPISTILTNVELIDTVYDCEGKQELKRIEIASKTLSRLYEDLTYLKLNHNYHREIESIDISKLLIDRIEYFHTLIESKKLKLIQHIEKNIIFKIDKNDAIRLIDNILSNAIKYNKKEGDIEIILNQEMLLVRNAGLGIRKEDIDLIKNRFKRANSSEGGFGIGLDIISQVVERYGFKFTINSIYTKSTEVKILWKK
jgi:two-component system OmpR family sensor kinase